MLVPLGDNDIGIFINNRLDLLEVTLGHSSIPFNMNVKRVVLLAVEEERTTLIVLC